MAGVTPRQLLYLALAIAGAAGTWYFNLQVSDLSAFFTAVWDTPLSASLTVDLLVAAATYLLFMIVEGRRLGMSPWLLLALLLLTGLVALACSFPLFLFLRERARPRFG